MENVPESGRSRVYRRIVDQLTTDPVLRGIVGEWICWDGVKRDAAKLAAQKPLIELYPTLGPVGFRGPEALVGDLEITIEMLVPKSFNACDCMDLWTAVENALYPVNDREKVLAFQAQLRGCDGSHGCDKPCDAETGEILISRPATIQQAPDGNGGFAHYVCTGSIAIRILRTINP